MACIGTWCERNNDSLAENPDQEPGFVIPQSVRDFFGGNGPIQSFCTSCILGLEAQAAGLVLKGQQQMLTQKDKIARHDAYRQAAMATDPAADPRAVAAYATAVADELVGRIT